MTDLERMLPRAESTANSMGRTLQFSERKLRLLGFDDEAIERIRQKWKVMK